MRVKMSKQLPPAPTASAIGPCPTIIQGGGSGGAMVLGKLPMPRRPTIWIRVGQGPTGLAVGAGGGWFDIFLSSILFLLPSLWVGWLVWV